MRSLDLKSLVAAAKRPVGKGRDDICLAGLRSRVTGVGPNDIKLRCLILEGTPDAPDRGPKTRCVPVPLSLDSPIVSTRQNFPYWIALGSIFRGWALSASGNTAEGISWIEDGIRNHLANSIMGMPYYLGLKAEALYLAGRTREALETIEEAEALGDRYEERNWRAEPHSLRGVFLAALGAEEAQIDASFCEAIRIAREQKSIFLEKRAEGAHAEYRRQKMNALGERGFRLPL
jgi:hypothetical protein